MSLRGWVGIRARLGVNVSGRQVAVFFCAIVRGNGASSPDRNRCPASRAPRIAACATLRGTWRWEPSLAHGQLTDAPASGEPQRAGVPGRWPWPLVPSERRRASVPRDVGAERHGRHEGPGAATVRKRAPGTPQAGPVQGLASIGRNAGGVPGADGLWYTLRYRRWYTLRPPQQRPRAAVAREVNRFVQQVCGPEILGRREAP